MSRDNMMHDANSYSQVAISQDHSTEWWKFAILLDIEPLLRAKYDYSSLTSFQLRQVSFRNSLASLFINNVGNALDAAWHLIEATMNWVDLTYFDTFLRSSHHNNLRCEKLSKFRCWLIGAIEHLCTPSSAVIRSHIPYVDANYLPWFDTVFIASHPISVEKK